MLKEKLPIYVVTSSLLEVNLCLATMYESELYRY